MRELELMLLVGLLTWALLGLRSMPAHVTRTLALFVGVVLVLHVTLEGWRWQAVPLYVLALWAGLGALRPPRRSTLRVVLASLLLALSGLLLWALPVIDPPPLGGEHAVAVRHEHWTDLEREDLRGGSKGERRELMISVWFPIDRAAGARAPYLPDFERSAADYAGKLGWPAWTLSHLRHARSRALTDGQPAAGRHPLVLYSHGLNRNRMEAASRMAELASHGLVVVAVDHPYGADFVRFPDGRVKRFVNLREADDSLDDIDHKRLSRVEIWQADLRFVLDRIDRLAEGGDPLWAGVDLEKIAALGFSNGGTTALLAAHRDPRIRAVVDLDGTPRGEVLESVVAVPVLFALSEPPRASDEDLARWGISRDEFLAPMRRVEDRMQRIAAAAASPVVIIRLAGSQHSNFTDAPLMSPLSARLGVGGTVDSREAMAAVDALILGFLDAAWTGGAWTPPESPLIQLVDGS